MQDKSFSWYADRIGSPSCNSAMRYYAHYIFPGTNKVYGYDLPKPSFEQFPHDTTYPLPLIATKYLANPTEDPIRTLVEQKQKYDLELSQIKHQYKLSMKKKTTKKLLKHKSADPIHVGLVHQYAEVFERNPDPYFSGQYNWYFTGGHMKTIPFDDDDWLFHVSGKELNEINMSRITHRAGQLLIEKCERLNKINEDLKSYGAIFEIRANTAKNMLLIRQKFMITTIDLHTSTVVNQIRSDIPYVSAAFENDSNVCITVNAKRTVELWQATVGTNTILTEGSLREESSTLPDNWSCVRGIRKNVFSYVDRDYIRLFDNREPITSTTSCFKTSLANLTDACEQITNLELSKSNRNLFYVSTTHRLFAIDIRNMSAKESKMIQWTHQLQTRPTMMSIIDTKSDDELIALAGVVPGEIRLCQTKKVDENTFCSPYLPFRPLSIYDSYDQATYRGHCLAPLSLVPNQIKMSSTGISLYKSKDSTIHLMVQNSGGDIFHQEIPARVDYIPNGCIDVTNKMNDWDHQLSELNDTLQSFSATDLTNFRSMADVLAKNITNPHGIGNSGMVDTTLVDITPNRRPPKWQQSYAQLTKYKDALAQDMLSIWDCASKKDEPQSSIPVTSADRISEWLQNTSKAIEGNPEESTTQLNTTLPKEFDEIDAMDTTHIDETLQTIDLSILSEILMPSGSEITRDRPIRKQIRKTRAFIPGF